MLLQINTKVIVYLPHPIYWLLIKLALNLNQEKEPSPIKYNFGKMFIN